jgi:hypothetical protein
MTKTAKLPRLTETSDGHHAVEIALGVRLVWWQTGDVWSIRIEGPPETGGGLDIRNVTVEPVVPKVLH